MGCNDSPATNNTTTSSQPTARSTALITDLSYDGAADRQVAKNFWQSLLWPTDRTLAAVWITGLPRNEHSDSNPGALQYRDGSGDNWKQVIIDGVDNTADYILLPNGAVAADDLWRLRYLRPTSGAHNTYFSVRLVDNNQRVSNNSRIYFRRGVALVSNDPLLIASDISTDDGALYFNPQIWTVHPGRQGMRFNLLCVSDSAAGVFEYTNNKSRWVREYFPTCGQLSAGVPFSVSQTAVWPRNGPFDTTAFRFTPASGWSGRLVMRLRITDSIDGRIIERTATIRYKE